MLPFLLHSLILLALTALTQIGGLAWLISLGFRRIGRIGRLGAFGALYLAGLMLAQQVAPQFGRVPLQCGTDGALQMQSWFYCATARNYVTPELAQTAEDLAQHMGAAYPGTITLVLDGNFPFLDGFPLLPHLSHADGRKLDLALYYMDAQGNYLAGVTRSPLGYFAFEDGPHQCPPAALTLRWDLAWLQPLMRNARPEPERMRAALNWLARDARVEKIFIEPHLRESLNLSSEKFRFQGCRAARHDDHLHFQI
ncbi:hypothetical protein HOY34_00315 [Xinfangfangia sp. D13-10-4-6]|nr:hypothetical protein [Pseudogemmobacter hezensis]